MTLTMPAAHPLRTVEALRATLLTGIDPRVVDGFYRAYWIDGRGPSEEATMRDVLGAAGHDASAILVAAFDEKKDDLRRRTDQAIALGIFGAPAFVVGGEMYWGQDRIELVEKALLASERLTGNRNTGVTRTWDTLSSSIGISLRRSPTWGAFRAEALAGPHRGAALEWRPMLLGAVFKAIGTADAPILTWSDAKRSYFFKDLTRWAAHLGVPFKFTSRFPMSTVKPIRVWFALPEARRAAFRDATFRAYWADDRDISDEATLRDLIGDGADEVIARCATKEVKDALFAGTQRAIDAGVFGAPTWIVDGKDLFWGQDRIVLVERALRA